VQSLVDERAAPELLAYEEDLIDRLRSMIGHQASPSMQASSRGGGGGADVEDAGAKLQPK